MQTMVSEIKSQLSYYLAQVNDGEQVVILDRDTPIAVLQRYQASLEGLNALVKKGIIQAAKQPLDKELSQPPLSDGCRASLVDLLFSERDKAY